MGTFLNFPIKEFIQQKCPNNININNHKKDIIKNKDKDDKELSIKFNLKSNYNISGIDSYQIIQIQSKNSICKIHINEMFFTGFICSISLANGKKIHTLITNGYFLQENIVEEKKFIKLTFDNKSISMTIQLSEDRTIIYDETKEIIIIQLKEYDRDNNGNQIVKSNYYLELDEIQFKKNFGYYCDKNAYMLEYMKNDKVNISMGKILTIEEDGKIKHQIDSGDGSSGAPILNLNTLKVFGLHHGFVRYKNYGIGRILYFAVNDFIHLLSNSY